MAWAGRDLKFGDLTATVMFKNKHRNIPLKRRKEKTVPVAITADRQPACGCGGKNMANLKGHSEGAPPCC